MKFPGAEIQHHGGVLGQRVFVRREKQPAGHAQMAEQNKLGASFALHFKEQIFPASQVEIILRRAGLS